MLHGTYVRTVPQEEAPHKVSCVTLVRHILNNASEGTLVLPRAYIGDLATILLRYHGAQIRDILDRDAQP